MSDYFDAEILLAKTVADYLRAQVSAGTQTDCPIVDFTDPMSVDNASRICVQVNSGESDEEFEGNAQFEVSVAMKSQWAQPTVTADYATHYGRVREVRTALWSSEIISDLQAKAGDTIGIAFVHPKRGFKTSVYDGWLYTETTLRINVFIKGA